MLHHAWEIKFLVCLGMVQQLAIMHKPWSSQEELLGEVVKKAGVFTVPVLVGSPAEARVCKRSVSLFAVPASSRQPCLRHLCVCGVCVGGWVVNTGSMHHLLTLLHQTLPTSCAKTHPHKHCRRSARFGINLSRKQSKCGTLVNLTLSKKRTRPRSSRRWLD